MDIRDLELKHRLDKRTIQNHIQELREEIHWYAPKNGKRIVLNEIEAETYAIFLAVWKTYGEKQLGLDAAKEYFYAKTFKLSETIHTKVASVK
ncbi:hypothetical protein [Rummeliibacillus suwonensis]|uniref:hypothetical protein n=1 Tax=Rummeliibacillus suwonensis TaxID=1306154 RepID=UPI001AAF77A5|nr:hypothetical protein [Rummeliibacillus suwonensis]MBO2535989.1 hypothetical protein [Rummeliibacillus suwonensis]